MFSDSILAQWEKDNGQLVYAKSIKRAELQTLARKCGISPGKLSVVHLRIVLASLKKHKLPRADQAVIDELTKKYNENLAGSFSYAMTKILYACGTICKEQQKYCLFVII